MSLPTVVFGTDVNKKKPLRASARTAGASLRPSLKGMKLNGTGVKQRTRDGMGPELSGSMTLEAAIAVPLFLFFVMNLLFVFEAVRLQSGLQAALQQAGEQICEAAYYTRFAVQQGQNGGSADTEGTTAGEGAADAESGQALSFILSETYVRNKVTSYLGEPFWRHTCVEGGRAGLSFAGSGIMTEGDRVEIVVSCRIRPFIRILAFPGFPMQARYCGHAWVGWTEGTGGDGHGGGVSGDRVYITKYGECYHTDPDCIYLNPQVRAVSGQEVDNYRNGDGAKYYPCGTCRPGKNGTVYITKEGDRYHSDRNCGGIVRHPDTMDSTAAATHYRPCPKCGKGH